MDWRFLMYKPPSKFAKQKDQKISKKVSYVDLLNGTNEIGGALLSDLAKETMHVRLWNDIDRKPKLSWDKKKERCTVSWSLLAKNFSIVQLSFTNFENVLKTVKSKASDSSQETRSSENPTTHSERYALGEAINEAIKIGWKPKGIMNPQPLKKPPSEEDLLQYREALKEVSIILYSEREPCHREHGTFPKNVKTCMELFNIILQGDNHHLYHSIDWSATQKEDFEKEVKDARQVYYQANNYQMQASYIDQHQKEVEELREKYQKHKQEQPLVLKKQLQQRMVPEEKRSQISPRKFEPRKVETKNTQVGMTQDDKKRKTQSSEKEPKKQKLESFAPEVNKDIRNKFKNIEKKYSHTTKQEQTVQSWNRDKNKPLLLQFEKESKKQISELSSLTQHKVKKKKKKPKDVNKRQ